MHAQTQSRQPKRIIAEPVDSVRYLITVHFKEEAAHHGGSRLPISSSTTYQLIIILLLY